MKKYFPILISIMVFTAFLAGQVLFDIVDISARQSGVQKKRYAHYEAVFSDITFNTSKNEEIRLSKLKSPIVVLNFWASWCIPCLEEFPSLAKMHSKFNSDEITVIGINSDEEDQKKNIQKIKKEYGLNFPMVEDKNGKILNKFMISAIPVSIIYHKGKVIEVSQGAKDFSSGETMDTLKNLLKK